MPLVSIILPNYNHSKFLKQRIDSILKQSFQNFELIILDDCSTDNSIDIIKSYLPNNKITQTVFNENNSGSTFLQWKKGFDLAKGEYIWIAESDDYSDISFLEKLVHTLEVNPDCVMTYSFSNLIDEKGNVILADWDRSNQIKQKVTIFDGREFAKGWMLFNNNIYNASMAVFRKSVLNNIDNSFTTYKYSGDWFFWNRICLEGKVIRYAEKLNFFRQYPEKVTSKADLEGLGFIEAKLVINDLINKLNLTSIQKTVVIGWFLKRITASKLYKTKDVNLKVLKEVKMYFKCNLSAIYIYKLDKRLNFSSLNIRKNRNS